PSGRLRDPRLAVGKHVVIVLVPLAGWTRSRGVLDDQRHAPKSTIRCPLHSITSSAIAISPGNTVSPSAFTVFMLITSSNLVGCKMGGSWAMAGVAASANGEPFRRKVPDEGVRRTFRSAGFRWIRSRSWPAINDCCHDGLSFVAVDEDGAVVGFQLADRRRIGGRGGRKPLTEGSAV